MLFTIMTTVNASSRTWYLYNTGTAYGNFVSDSFSVGGKNTVIVTHGSATSSEIGTYFQIRDTNSVMYKYGTVNDQHREFSYTGKNALPSNTNIYLNLVYRNMGSATGTVTMNP